jgi:hypothetical protein
MIRGWARFRKFGGRGSVLHVGIEQRKCRGVGFAGTAYGDIHELVPLMIQDA